MDITGPTKGIATDRIYDASLPLYVRTHALSLLITMDWVRSANSANRKRHPTLEEYISHWLVANGDDRKSADVVAALRAEYPPPKKPKLPHGRTYLVLPERW